MAIFLVESESDQSGYFYSPAMLSCFVYVGMG